MWQGVERNPCSGWKPWESSTPWDNFVSKAKKSYYNMGSRARRPKRVKVLLSNRYDLPRTASSPLETQKNDEEDLGGKEGESIMPSKTPPGLRREGKPP